ncbi:MAG: hypothetical protein FWC72_08560, partial [Oscillospiraceae bacterium]|nr:hypothetical protein [Oscillospiraceae bacterium]
LGTPFDEGLAVLGGKAVRHRKALLHVLLRVEPLFLAMGNVIALLSGRTQKLPPPNFQNPSPTQSQSA